MGTFKCIYMQVPLTDLDFLLCMFITQKMQFLGKLKDHSEEGNLETGQMIQSLHLFFFTLTVCKIHFLY